MKDTNVVGNKMTRNARKLTFQKVVSFLTEQTLHALLEPPRLLYLTNVVYLGLFR